MQPGVSCHSASARHQSAACVVGPTPCHCMTACWQTAAHAAHWAVQSVTVSDLTGVARSLPEPVIHNDLLQLQSALRLHAAEPARSMKQQSLIETALDSAAGANPPALLQNRVQSLTDDEAGSASE